MFTNLHRHSRWSLLDGTGSGDQYAKRAVELGQHALAVTDHGTLAGALEHIQSCYDNDIMPIMGVEVYFRENRLDHNRVPGVDKNGKKIMKLPKRFHLTLLAMNFEGWLSIQRLTSEAYRTGLIDHADKPCVDWDVLSRHREGVYCLGGCFGSLLSQDILTGGARVDMIVNQLRSIYNDNFSLEIMPHDWDEQRRLNIDNINVAQQYGIGVAATGDTHIPFKDWGPTQETMLMLSTGQSNLKRKKKRESGEEIYTMEKANQTLHLMSESEMASSFAAFHPHIPSEIVNSALHHTGDIIKDFVPFLMDRSIKMPKFSREVLMKIDPFNAFDTADPDDLVKNTLRRWAKEGLDDLEELYPASHWEKFPRSLYESEIEKEFAVFDAIGMHVWRYMLMVAGEIRWARSQGIIVGPGRGSAAGSRVAYVIGITDIDPLSYDLMFERFININRKGMPDIDIDFMPGARGRDLVEAHTGMLYNEGFEQNVIKIAAYGTYGPKGALRAVCRVFDDKVSYNEADRIVKVLDVLKPVDKINLPGCAERFPEIKQFSEKYPALWDIAIKIEGHPSTSSEHASGVLVKPTNVQVPTAVKKDKDTEETVTTTAWSDSREQLANVGFLKIDYLVIDGLVRQYEIMKALRERENTHIDLRTLPVRWDPYACEDDVLDILRRGMTLGVWQFEGRGTIPVLKAIQPDNMHDIAAVNALIRPGARGAGMTELYAKIKHGLEPLTYWHDSVEPVLKNTFGLMIYQEQMMEIAVQLGDFDRSEADDLRKAMGKKYREGLQAVIKFLDDLGFGPKFIHNASMKVGEENATMIWEKKMLPFGEYSFNASHAYAYGLISYHDTKLKKESPADFYSGYLSGAKTADLPIKLAGAMREGSRFDVQVKPPNINTSGRGFTVEDMKTIVYGIESVKGIGDVGANMILQNRPFFSFEDFENKVPAKNVNKNAKKALIHAGAFDAFGLRMMMNEEERGEKEEEYIGMRLSGKSEIQKHAELVEATIHTEEEFDEAAHGEWFCVGGEVINIKPTKTKAKQEDMGFVTVAYGTDTVRVTLFAKTWAMWGHTIKMGQPIFFQGKKDISEQYGHGFIAQECITLDDLVERSAALV